jgi:large subunit ribosomal protein L18
MIKKVANNELRKIRHQRIRQKMIGTIERPRLSVFISNKYIYTQIIDDTKGHTLAAAKSEGKLNAQTASELGAKIAGIALQKGVKQVVFDRGGYLFHGRIAKLAQAARDAGLDF